MRRSAELPARSILGIFVLALLTGAAPLAEGLSTLFQAHGGLALWRQQGGMEFEVSGWPCGAETLRDHPVIDLGSSHLLVIADRYRIADDGKGIWIAPNKSALACSPAAYIAALRQSIRMPFLLGTPGTRSEALGHQSLAGHLYEAWSVQPESTTAGAERYRIFAATDTHRLAVVQLLRADGTPEQMTVFERWQEVEDLWVPEVVSLHEGKDDELGAKQATLHFSHIQFHSDRPEPELFALPAGAERL